MTRTHRRTTDERLYAVAQQTLPPDPAPVPDAHPLQHMEARPVTPGWTRSINDAEVEIRLADALFYAGLMQSTHVPPEQEDGSQQPT